MSSLRISLLTIVRDLDVNSGSDRYSHLRSSEISLVLPFLYSSSCSRAENGSKWALNLGLGTEQVK